MPDRIIRAELLTSEAWLGLKNNDDRVCWVVLFLNADTLGNQPAGPYRIIHLCRHAGIDTPEKVAKVLSELSDVDLIRCYQIDSKPYLHIPRFNQSRRFLGKLWPVPPWATSEEKQAFTNKSQVNHRIPPVTHGEPPEGVGVGVGVGVRTKTPLRTGVRVSPDSLPDGFAEFWQHYPKKVEKKAAIKAWAKIKPDLELQKKIAKSLMHNVKSEQWTKDGGKYIKHAAAWLNGERWDDVMPSAESLGYNPEVLAMLRQKYGPNVRPVEQGKFYDPGLQVRFSPEGKMHTPI